MENKAIKDDLNRIVNELISSNYSDITSKINKNEGVILNMHKKRKNYIKWSVTFATIGLVLMVGIFTNSYLNGTKIMATVNIDVNPSIELKINKKYKIMNVVSHNEDAKKIVGDMDLIGSSIEVGTNALIGSMLKLGYISDAKNSILISVLGDDKNLNENLKKDISEDIHSYLESNNINGSIMSQTITDDNSLQSLSEKYNVSVGKVELINKIILGNPLYSFDELVKLSTNELNLLINSKKNNIEDIDTEGEVSSGEYIGVDKTKKIICTHANVNESSITNVEIDMDYENGIMIYEMEFDYKNYEYDYEIDAKTGKIINYEKSGSDNYTESISDEYISKTKAKNIALASAGITNYSDYDIEFSFKSGVAIYEISFETNSKEYEYIINAKTGAIISSEKENKDDEDDEQPQEVSSYITKTKAKSIAINHSGVSNYYEYEIETDTNNGIRVYEISFETNSKEYDYVINAKTGAIISSEKENKDDEDDEQPQEVSSYITKTKAKSIAINHSGVSNYYEYEIETDTDNGVSVYEISFETNSKEYEYVINAKTGAIITSEEEGKDD